MNGAGGGGGGEIPGGQHIHWVSHSEIIHRRGISASAGAFFGVVTFMLGRIDVKRMAVATGRMRIRGAVWMSLVCIALAGCAEKRAAKTAEEWLREGWGNFRLEEFDEAEGDFSAALAELKRATTAENDGRRINAIYGMGMVASLGRHGGETERAREYFEQVMALDDPAKGGNGEMAAWAMLAMVREKYLPARSDGTPDNAAAQAGYAQVMARYPGRAAAEEAFLDHAELLVQSFGEEDARRTVEEVTAYLKAHPRTRVASGLYALVSKAHEVLHEYPEALTAAIASLDAKEKDPANPSENNILELYRIGMMAQFDVGDFATARKYYQRFLAEYPRDQRAFNVRLLLANMDAAEKAMKDGKPVPELSDLTREPVEGR